jgi:hypothetical protein
VERTRQIIEKFGFICKENYELPTSTKTFSDGAQYRIEIPSCEGVKSLEAVLETAKKLDVPIHRVSQGSGIMLYTDDELNKIVDLARQENRELSLFVGPRGNWDINPMPFASAGKIFGQRIESMTQMVHAIEDIKRGCNAGLRSVLVADEGLLWLVNEFKKLGELPKDLVIKISVQMGQSNPVSIKLMEGIGADTFNVPTDLTLAQLSAIRQSVDIPIDVYVEVPDDLGGFIRHYDIPEIIRVAAPVYIKFGLRNAPNIYPSGTHLEETSIALSKERVRRARIGYEMIQRYAPHLKTTDLGTKREGVPAEKEIPSLIQ